MNTSLNFSNGKENKITKRYYCDNSSEIIPENYESTDQIYAINDNELYEIEVSNEKTASGSIASFSDGADNVPVEALTVSLEPVQDLHGQASPYPAGGGKNILAPTFYNGIGYNVAVGTVLNLTEATNVSVSGNTYTKTVGDWGGFGMCSPQLATGTYYLMAELTSVNMRSSLYVLNSDMSVSRNLGNIGSGTTRSIGMVITLSGDEAYIAFNCLTASAGNVSISTPMVVLSSTATSFAPYSNICPITGHTQAQVWRAGKNLADKDIFDINKPSWATSQYWLGLSENSDGTYTLTRPVGWGGNGMVYIGTYPAGTYTVSFNLVSTASVTCGASLSCMLTKTWERNAITSKQGLTTAGRVTLEAVTTTAMCDFWLAVGPWTDNGVQVISGDYQVEVGSTASAYEAYNGISIEIPLGQTVYGGTVDVVGGVLTVDRAMVTFDGVGQNFNYVLVGGKGRIAWNDIQSVGKIGTKAFLSNVLATSETYTATPDAWVVANSGDRVIRCFIGVPDSIASGEDWRAYCAENPIQMVYELAEPITIQLTPHELTTLLGQNNIWSDSGDVDVTYRADIQRYISKVISEALA